MSNTAKKQNQTSPESYNPKRPEILSLAGEYGKTTSIEELQRYVDSNGEPPKSSNKIEGIRRLWHDDDSENSYFEGCCAATMKAIGASQEYNYMFFNIVCGGLFTQTYNSSTSAGFSGVFNPCLVEHVFDLCGYSYLYIDQQMIGQHYDLVMNTIKTAIDKGIPVMTAGVGNVQLNDKFIDTLYEWSTIGGYDENDILYVNIYCRDIVTDKNGYCTIEGGLKKSKGLYIIGEKYQDISISDCIKRSILSIPIFISLPPLDAVSFGQQAYYDWADGLLDEKNMDRIETDPYQGFLWEGHHAPWIVALTNECHLRIEYDHIIQQCSDFSVSGKVKEIYTIIYEDLPMIQKLHGGEFFATIDVIKKLEVRKELATVLRKMGDLHNKLFELFEK